MRFQRDLDSDWTVKNNKPVFDIKEHMAVDVESGLVLSICVSNASEHNTKNFSYTVTKGLHGRKPHNNVYADKRTVLNSTEIFWHQWYGWLYHEKEPDQCLPLQKRRFWGTKNIQNQVQDRAVLWGIIHKHHGAGKARFTTIIKENWDHLCGAMAFNINRVVLKLRKREMMIVTMRGKRPPKAPLWATRVEIEVDKERPFLIKT